jgi:thioredoxin 1
MSDPVIVVHDGNFQQEILASPQPALVDFWGPACGPCKALEPVIAQVATTYQGRLKVAKLDISTSTKTAIQFAVRNLPTLLLFKDGKVVEQITGRPSFASIQKAITRILG